MLSKRPCFELQYMAFYAPKDALLKHKRPHIGNSETFFDKLGGIYFRNKGFLAIFALNMNFVMTDYDHTKQTYLK